MSDLTWLDGNLYTEGFVRALADGSAGSTVYNKIGLQNNLTRVLPVTLSIDMFAQSDFSGMISWAADLVTLSCPYNVAAELIAGGSLAADTEYFYRITAFNAIGETVGSLEVSALTDSSNKSIKLTWDKIEGAEGYLIYRSTNQIYTSARRMVIEDPDTLEWTDTGQAASQSGPYSFPGINTDFDLPDENTTAGESPDYGTPPSTFVTTDLTLSLEPGEQAGLWLKIVIPIGASESLNPRNAYLTPTEIL
jgi:hypothetical protein